MNAEALNSALATLRAARPTDAPAQWLPVYNELARVWQELSRQRRPYAIVNLCVAVVTLTCYGALWAFVPVVDVSSFVGVCLAPPAFAVVFVAVNNAVARRRHPLLAQQDVIQRACAPFRAAANAMLKAQT